MRSDRVLYLEGQAVALDVVAWERHMRRLEEVPLPPRREYVVAELRRLFCGPPPVLSDELRRELARYHRSPIIDNGDYHA